MNDTPQLTPKSVLTLLKAEIAIQRTHHRLLLDQRAALLANDAQAFSVAHLNYELFGVQLQEHAAMRRSVIGSETVSLRNLAGTWPAAERTTAIAMLDTLAALITKVKNLADQNTGMVSNQLMYTQFMLSVMVRAGRRNLGYTAPLAPPSIYSENLFLNQLA